METIQLSDCCNAEVVYYKKGNEMGKRCGECHDVCGTTTVCAACLDTGFIEIYGDGDNFEWDVVGTQPCPECNA